MRETTIQIGNKYGSLVVLDYGKIGKGGHRYYLCKCDCGKEKEISGSHLVTGASKTCGCGVAKAIISRCTTHGGTHTRLFTIWQGMKRRCYNPNDKSFKYYGGRGITVCKEWLNDFEAFALWGKAHGYEESLTIDRVDNEKGYSPSNCIWSTMAYQNQHKRAPNGYKIR